MKRFPLPAVPSSPDRERHRFDTAIHQRVSIFSGEVGTKIKMLDPATATPEDCANKINEILTLLYNP